LPGAPIMKSTTAPIALLVVLFAGYVAFVLLSTAALPERVATHFDLAGNANDWMSRRQHLAFMLVLGTAYPLVLAGSGLFVRVVPDEFFNLPRRAYWLAPERRAETVGYITRHMLWLSCLAVLFVAGLQYSIFQANHVAPARLSIWWLAGSFLAATLVWAALLVRHFYRGA
jgi:hypothetical protein